MVRVNSVDELRGYVESNSVVHIDLESPFDLSHRTPNLSLAGLKEVEDWRLEDQIVRVQSGMKLSELNAKLGAEGFEIPIGLRPQEQEVSVGSLISMNLPHWNMKTGSWRDWVTAIRFVTADGKFVKSGADVVKSVTGFDLHKLLIGSRGSLGIPVSVTLVVKPKKQPVEYPPLLVEGQDLVLSVANELSHVPSSNQEKFAARWTTTRALKQDDFDQPAWMRKMKDEFDPTHKLNPGVMGIF